VVSEFEALLRLALAAGLGAFIGLDREARDKPAGVRTFSLVALGACLFTLVGTIAFAEDDSASRIASTIVTGVGFLGAGTILHRRSDVVGLTTAAGLWASAAVGMAAGVGLYVLATGGAVLILSVLWLIGRLVAAQADHDKGPSPTAGRRTAARAHGSGIETKQES
jgi:putative Mg2+ transporter-C (MgtC) family protein